MVVFVSVGLLRGLHVSVCVGQTPFGVLWLTQCPHLPTLPSSEGISEPRPSRKSWGVAAPATRCSGCRSWCAGAQAPWPSLGLSLSVFYIFPRQSWG